MCVMKYTCGIFFISENHSFCELSVCLHSKQPLLSSTNPLFLKKKKCHYHHIQGPPGKFLGLEEGSADFQVRLLLYTLCIDTCQCVWMYTLVYT